MFCFRLFPLNGHSLMLLISFKRRSGMQYFCPVSWWWISKQDAYFFPPLFVTVRHRSLSFCLQLQVQPGDSFFLQLHFQEKTKSWLFSKLSIGCFRVRSESTPSPAAGTLSKKRGIECNTSQSWCCSPADKQGGTWPWRGMCRPKSRCR